MGDFEPSLYRTPLFEVGFKRHRQGSHWLAHAQQVATEYNLVVSGTLQLNDHLFHADDLIVVDPGEVVQPLFLTDCQVVVVKVPSLPQDKVLI